MLFIKKIKFKNILSSGNQFTELDFTTNKTTLIKGNSGQGKSLIITALIFGLYGKSNRGTTKKQLVNSVNKKDCLVEVEFSIDGKLYNVIRGISPNIFQIYVNGSLQDELSAIKDQQKYLETNILKMSYKTFMQIVVLGSNNYTPFMQLSASERRDLVEELLDIRIFSTMNSIIKEKVKSVESNLKDIESKIISTEEKIDMQEKFIETIKKDGLKLIEVKNDKINILFNNKKILEDDKNNLIESLEENQNKLSSISFSKSKLKKLLTIQGKLVQKKSNLMENIEFFTNNSICPTCSQDIDENFKIKNIKNINLEIQKIEEGYSELISTIKEEEDIENKILSLENTIQTIHSNIKNKNREIAILDNQIQDLIIEVDNIKINIENQEENNNQLNKLKTLYKKLEKDRIKCKEAYHYFEFTQLLLKDGGIKSKIIKKYLPIINFNLNKFLQMLDLYLNFTLDEEFKESINTPIHQGFTYSCFSEGEKQRINLSAILSWREIARLKNSANCNLIFFDETLDSSLDSSGIDDFIKIINYVITDSNIFVISHREGFEDRFQNVLEVKKVGGFSKIF